MNIIDNLHWLGHSSFRWEVRKPCIHCDVALLPVSGTYVMTADEAAQAALAIKPKVAVPMHYGEVVGSPADAKHFRDALAAKIDVNIMQKER